MDRNGRKTRILLVEDNITTRYAVGRILLQAGYQVLEAETGFEGLVRAQECPDVIVLDVQLPDLDGFEVCQKIKANPRTHLIPILQVSAVHVSTQARARGLEGGADAYLTHPIPAEVLIGTIKALLRIRTTEAALQSSQQRLSLALEAANMGTFDWNIQSNICYWDERHAALFGFPIACTEGAPELFLNRIHPDEREQVEQILRKALSDREVFSYQFRVILPESGLHWLYVTGKALYDETGEAYRFIGLVMDITERVSVEQEILQSQEGLREALSLRDEFLSVASHELKTPLATLKLQSQAIQKLSKSKENMSRVALIASKIDKHVDLLVRLVDDMLDITRLKTGMLTIKRSGVNICELINEIVEKFHAMVSFSAAEMIIEQCEFVIVGSWDRSRLEQVITNLLTNAMRYGGGKPIKIRVDKFDGTVRVSVHDQGKGIADADKERIFQRFERAGNANIAGLGLGLYISKQIVELHGGKLYVESEEGAGSTFVMELPI